MCSFPRALQYMYERYVINRVNFLPLRQFYIWQFISPANVNALAELPVCVAITSKLFRGRL